MTAHQELNSAPEQAIDDASQRENNNNDLDTALKTQMMNQQVGESDDGGNEEANTTSSSDETISDDKEGEVGGSEEDNKDSRTSSSSSSSSSPIVSSSPTLSSILLSSPTSLSALQQSATSLSQMDVSQLAALLPSGLSTEQIMQIKIKLQQLTQIQQHRKLERSASEPQGGGLPSLSAELTSLTARLDQDQINNLMLSNSTDPTLAAVASLNSSRYKTELCRPFEENGSCKYGDKCQFAHGHDELRSLTRHPKYKTELCRTFHTTGLCPYGPRCHFIHNSNERAAKTAQATKSSPPASISVSSTSSQENLNIVSRSPPNQCINNNNSIIINNMINNNNLLPSEISQYKAMMSANYLSSSPSSHQLPMNQKLPSARSHENLMYLQNQPINPQHSYQQNILPQNILSTSTSPNQQHFKQQIPMPNPTLQRPMSSSVLKNRLAALRPKALSIGGCSSIINSMGMMNLGSAGDLSSPPTSPSSSFYEDPFTPTPISSMSHPHPSTPFPHFMSNRVNLNSSTIPSSSPSPSSTQTFTFPPNASSMPIPVAPPVSPLATSFSSSLHQSPPQLSSVMLNQSSLLSTYSHSRLSQQSVNSSSQYINQKSHMQTSRRMALPTPSFSMSFGDQLMSAPAVISCSSGNIFEFPTSGC